MRLARSVTIAPRGESHQLGIHSTHYATLTPYATFTPYPTCSTPYATAVAMRP